MYDVYNVSKILIVYRYNRLGRSKPSGHLRSHNFEVSWKVVESVPAAVFGRFAVTRRLIQVV